MSIQKKTVLITGASSGIGLDVARGFQVRGANVVLKSRSQEKLVKAAAAVVDPDRVAIVSGNNADKSTGEHMVLAALERFGSVDVLVNSAGIFQPKPFLDVTEDELDRNLATNIKGAYLTTQAAVRQMKKQGGGAVVNIGTVLVGHSVAGLTASAPLTGKGALHALTISLSSELSQYGIRVNTVAPGVVRTPIYGDADVDAFSGMALLDRVGEVADTTEAVIYLATAPFATGVILNLDGGFVSGRR